jgi:hypothetical protein
MSDQSWPPRDEYTKRSKAETSAKSQSGSSSKSARRDWVMSHSRRLFASYRRDDYSAPETFVLMLCELLERYPDHIIERATGSTGIQFQFKHPPSLAEIKSALDEIQRSSSYARQWDERSKRQLEERRQLEELQKEEIAERRAEVVDRIKNELRTEAGFVFPEDRKDRPRSLSWKQYTTEELLKMYPPRKIPEQNDP